VIDDVPDGVRTKDIHTFLLPNIPRR
jgi:hypothetical protein